MGDAPPARFDELGVDPRLLKALRKLGVETPTAVQARAIPLALGGKDVLARAPTGSGKTYAYALPLLQKVLTRQDAASAASAGRVGGVVLVPTTELCHQVHAVMRALLGHAGAGHTRVMALTSAADGATLGASGVPDVLVATPAQLLAHLGTLHLSDGLDMLVVDEADLLLSYGYGDDIASLGDVRTPPRLRPRPRPPTRPPPRRMIPCALRRRSHRRCRRCLSQRR